MISVSEQAALSARCSARAVRRAGAHVQCGHCYSSQAHMLSPRGLRQDGAQSDLCRLRRCATAPAYSFAYVRRRPSSTAPAHSFTFSFSFTRVVLSLVDASKYLGIDISD